MTGHKPNIFWFLCWKYLAPAVMFCVFVFYVTSFKPVKLGDYSYPTWAEGLGLCFSFASMMWIPIYAVYYLVSQPGTLMQVSTPNSWLRMAWVMLPPLPRTLANPSFLPH